MKKNVMMRVASLMLVMVLMTSSVISGTFAKYVTSGTGSDTARVAKFGVEVTANGEMFLKNYEKTDGTYTLGTNTVESSDTWKLVAPGTTKGMTEVQLTGTPEVATRVTYGATVTLDAEKWKVAGEEYFPVYFTIEGMTYGTDDSGLGFDYTFATVAELKTNVEAAIEACAEDYAPNTNLSTVSGDYPTVSWCWPFYTSDANDVKDTALGDKAVAEDITISVAITTTVTQID